MSITITGPTGGHVGPGWSVGWSSDQPSSTWPGTHWELTVSNGAGIANLITSKPITQNFDAVIIGVEGGGSSTQVLGGVLLEEGACTVRVQQRRDSDGGLVDTSPPLSAQWDTTSYSWFQEKVLVETAPRGGLTTEQATQLQQTHDQTFLSKSLDALTLIALTSGPTGGTVSQNLIGWIFGVIVRIAGVPEDFHVNTPDGDYWTKTLAVVRIYRGIDLYKRVPVHTSSKLISFGDEGLVTAVSALSYTQWLVQMSVQVSFSPGVTGEVFLMQLP